MNNVIGVRFKKSGKIYYFDPAGLNFDIGENVIVETKRGVEFGTCVIGNKQVGKEDLVAPLKPVIRKADELDKVIHKENLKKAKDAYDICTIKIKEHEMDMKLVGAEYTFDNNKLIFYFTADERVDFRDLVKDLASIFKLRIELRQIGVRDQTKIIGGMGICGRVVCCKQFIAEFEPVTMNMAKDQGLSLNPTKISGVCGRLMCCLSFEHETYEESLKSLPKYGTQVQTPEGIGDVVGSTPLKEVVRVKLKNADGDFYFGEFPLDQIKVPCKKNCCDARTRQDKEKPAESK